ncbi:hypothetical protein IFR05_000759 [Cadophora sp. M221]|nr:hypothetical protein IFR05_000759 [Cadophora sp. M221]
MENWSRRRVPDLKSELSRRNLPKIGFKGALVVRLNHTNALPITLDGRKSAYAQQIRKFRERSLAQVESVNFFAKLPPEIRQHIWLLSLPGPRVLTMYSRADEDRLYFQESVRPPNPVTLRVCRESREVALRRYKLCFGTPNVYADFPGGDIIYFDSYMIPWKWTLSNSRSRRRSVPQTLSPEIRAELATVVHMALSHRLWIEYSNPFQYIGQRDGGVLRQELQKYEGLKRVYLFDDRRKKMDDLFCGHPSIGDPYFEKRPKDLPRDMGGPMVGYIGDDPAYDGWKKRNVEVRDNPAALGVLTTWDLKDLTSVEIEKGIPIARIVEMEWVVDEPCRIRENEDFQ